MEFLPHVGSCAKLQDGLEKIDTVLISMVLLPQSEDSESVSCSVMSDSLWPHGLCQAPLSLTLSLRLLKLMSIGSLMPSNHRILYLPLFSCPQSFPASGSFPLNQLFASGGQSIGASAAASILPANIQGWFPLGLTGLISLLSKEISRVFSSTTINIFHQIRKFWAIISSNDFRALHSF